MMTALALLVRYWKIAAIVALAGVATVLWRRHDAAQQALGAARVRIRAQDSALAVGLRELAKVETLYVRDTVLVTRLATRTITLHDTVLAHLTDTVAVRSYIETADSAAHACLDLLQRCNERNRLAVERFAVYDAKIATLTAAPNPSALVVPPRSRHWTADVTKIGVGFLLGGLAGWAVTR